MNQPLATRHSWRSRTWECKPLANGWLPGAVASLLSYYPFIASTFSSFISPSHSLSQLLTLPETSIFTKVTNAATMSYKYIVIDPDGDTLIRLPSPEKSDCSTGKGYDFKVSQKQLLIASPRAKRVLQGPFIEAVPHADGLRHWKLITYSIQKLSRLSWTSFMRISRKFPTKYL